LKKTIEGTHNLQRVTYMRKRRANSAPGGFTGKREPDWTSSARKRENSAKGKKSQN